VCSGNIFVQFQPNGEPRLVILDCGIVYQSRTDLEHQKLVDICFSFMQHDGRKAAKLMIESVNDKTVRKCFDIYTTIMPSLEC
jgi:predicted unusual protein kinase regulating ubiquinone biosynthesis (AarF/ABC1/UbiB family)